MICFESYCSVLLLWSVNTMMFVFEFLVHCLVEPTKRPTAWNPLAQRIYDNFRKGAIARKEI
jgi:hypothetical protein